MARLALRFLSPGELQEIHDTSMRTLARIGLKVPSQEILDLLNSQEGICVDREQQVVTFNEDAVMAAIAMAPRTFSVYGRDKTIQLAYGEEAFHCQAIPGEAHWVDPTSKSRREARWEDFEKCVLVADALPHIDIVGAMVQPAETPVQVRDIHLYAELLKRTRKPVRSWVYNRTSARYIIKMLEVLAGGSDEIRTYPMAEFGLEPISPLQLPHDALEAALEFARVGVPITLGPMPQAMGTGPVTLAGSIAQGNAECLGTLTVIQTITPGTPVIYYNAPHIMDPRTMNMVFGSPEQGLMGVAVAELGKYYGLPVGVNVGFTDAKVPDAQAGSEIGMTLLLGALAGADIFGGMGIAGCDQGFSLPQLIIDDEIIGFVKRVLRGMRVDTETCAYDVIEQVGIGGMFLTHDHTLALWRDEFWIPELCDRNLWEPWLAAEGKTMLDRAIDRQENILSTHTLEWLDADTQRELDAIIAVAEREILVD